MRQQRQTSIKVNHEAKTRLVHCCSHNSSSAWHVTVQQCSRRKSKDKSELMPVKSNGALLRIALNQKNQFVRRSTWMSSREGYRKSRRPVNSVSAKWSRVRCWTKAYLASLTSRRKMLINCHHGSCNVMTHYWTGLLVVKAAKRRRVTKQKYSPCERNVCDGNILHCCTYTTDNINNNNNNNNNNNPHASQNNSDIPQCTDDTVKRSSRGRPPEQEQPQHQQQQQHQQQHQQQPQQHQQQQPQQQQHQQQHHQQQQHQQQLHDQSSTTAIAAAAKNNKLESIWVVVRSGNVFKVKVDGMLQEIPGPATVKMMCRERQSHSNRRIASSSASSSSSSSSSSSKSTQAADNPSAPSLSSTTTMPTQQSVFHLSRTAKQLCDTGQTTDINCRGGEGGGGEGGGGGISDNNVIDGAFLDYNYARIDPHRASNGTIVAAMGDPCNDNHRDGDDQLVSSDHLQRQEQFFHGGENMTVSGIETSAITPVQNFQDYFAYTPTTQQSPYALMLQAMHNQARIQHAQWMATNFDSNQAAYIQNAQFINPSSFIVPANTQIHNYHHPNQPYQPVENEYLINTTKAALIQYLSEVTPPIVRQISSKSVRVIIDNCRTCPLLENENFTSLHSVQLKLNMKCRGAEYHQYQTLPVCCHGDSFAPNDEEFTEIYRGSAVDLSLVDLSPACSYSIRYSLGVISLAMQIFGCPSKQIDFWTDADVPDAPTGLQIVSRSNKSLALKWIVPEDNGYRIDCYEIEAETDMADGFQPVITSRATSCKSQRLARRSIVKVRVRAVSQKGRGLPSYPLIINNPTTVGHRRRHPVATIIINQHRLLNCDGMAAGPVISTSSNGSAATGNMLPQSSHQPLQPLASRSICDTDATTSSTQSDQLSSTSSSGRDGWRTRNDSYSDSSSYNDNHYHMHPHHSSTALSNGARDHYFQSSSNGGDHHHHHHYYTRDRCHPYCQYTAPDDSRSTVIESTPYIERSPDSEGRMNDSGVKSYSDNDTASNGPRSKCQAEEVRVEERLLLSEQPRSSSSGNCSDDVSNRQGADTLRPDEHRNSQRHCTDTSGTHLPPGANVSDDSSATKSCRTAYCRTDSSAASAVLSPCEVNHSTDIDNGSSEEIGGIQASEQVDKLNLVRHRRCAIIDAKQCRNNDDVPSDCLPQQQQQQQQQGDRLLQSGVIDRTHVTLTAGKIGGRTVELYWTSGDTDRDSILIFRLEWTDDVEQNRFDVVYQGPDTGFTHSNLKPKHVQKYRLGWMRRGRDDQNEIWTVSEDNVCRLTIRTCITNPTSPRLLQSRCNSQSSRTLNIAWERPECDGGSPVSSFLIFVNDEFTAQTDHHEYQLWRHLAADTVYEVRVSAVNDDGMVSQLSESVCLTTLSCSLTPPRNVRLVSAGSSTLKLRWDDAGVDAGGTMSSSEDIPLDCSSKVYSLEMNEISKEVVDYSQTLPDAIRGRSLYTGNRTTFKVSKLQEATSYGFRLCSKCCHGRSQWTKPYIFRTCYSQPQSLCSGVKCKSVDHDRMLAKWNSHKPIDRSIVEYRLEVREVTAPLSKPFTTVYTGCCNAYKLTGLRSNTEYQLRVWTVRKIKDNDDSMLMIDSAQPSPLTKARTLLKPAAEGSLCLPAGESRTTPGVNISGGLSFVKLKARDFTHLRNILASPVNMARSIATLLKWVLKWLHEMDDQSGLNSSEVVVTSSSSCSRDNISSDLTMERLLRIIMCNAWKFIFLFGTLMVTLAVFRRRLDEASN